MMFAAARGVQAAVVSAALCVFARLQITYINLWFVFLFFAHITFL